MKKTTRYSPEIRERAVCFFRPGGARPRTEMMATFIDEHRAEYGVEPICIELPIAPSAYYEHKSKQKDPSREPARLQRDRVLSEEIRPEFARRTLKYMVPGRCGFSLTGKRYRSPDVRWSD